MRAQLRHDHELAILAIDRRSDPLPCQDRAVVVGVGGAQAIARRERVFRVQPGAEDEAWLDLLHGAAATACGR